MTSCSLHVRPATRLWTNSVYSIKKLIATFVLNGVVGGLAFGPSDASQALNLSRDSPDRHQYPGGVFTIGHGVNVERSNILAPGIA